MKNRYEASVKLNGTTIGIVRRITVNASPERDLHGPAVVRAANGDLLLSHQDSITRAGKDGFCRQWRSTDDGLTWQDEGPVADWRDRGLQSLFGEYCLAPNDNLVMTVQRRNVDQADPRYSEGILDSWIQISDDHGRTWTEIGPVDGSDESAVRFMRNLNERDGIIYGLSWSVRGSTLYSSADNGLSWQRQTVVFPNDYPDFPEMKTGGPPYYPHIVFCPDGSMLAMCYITPPVDYCYSRRSRDLGRTWEPIKAERGLALWAPRLKRLDDEVLILTGRDKGGYGGGRGTVAWFSTDSGETWGSKLIVDAVKYNIWASYAYSDSISAGDNQFWVFTSTISAEANGDIVGVLLEVS